MHEESRHEAFLNSARDAFAFLCDDSGFLLADAERRGPFGAVLTWRADTRAVQVYSSGGAGQGVDVSCEGHEVPLETIPALNRVRRRVPSPLPASDPLGVQRLADTTRRYAAPWLRGDRAAFQAAHEYMDVVNAWGMRGRRGRARDPAGSRRVTEGPDRPW